MPTFQFLLLLGDYFFLSKTYICDLSPYMHFSLCATCSTDIINNTLFMTLSTSPVYPPLSPFIFIEYNNLC